MNNQPLVTIIIPIYNVEKYLNKCLDSVLQQTLMNHKAILVDDGSKDRSGEIAKAYAEKYPEVFLYILKENAGLGAARNTGMSYADTPFLMFLDSDDWLQSRTIENITKKIGGEQEFPDIGFMSPIVYDMVTGGFTSWNDTDELERLFLGRNTISPKSVPEMYALEASVCRSLWRTAFLRENNFSFPEGTKWEDVFPHFFLYHHAARCVKIDNAGFYYRVNSGNQITASGGMDRLDVISVFSKTIQYAIANHWNKVEIAYIVHMMMLFSRWSIDVAMPDVKRILVQALHELFTAIPKEYFDEYERIHQPNRKMRVFLWGIKTPLTYRLLGDYMMIDAGKRVYEKLKVIKRKLRK